MAMVATGRTEEGLAQAIAGTKRQIGFYASTPAYKPVLDHHGWGDLHAEAHAFTKAGRWTDWGLRRRSALRREARRKAREERNRKVLFDFTGTGPQGSITRDDVQAAVSAPAPAVSAPVFSAGGIEVVRERYPDGKTKIERQVVLDEIEGRAVLALEGVVVGVEELDEFADPVGSACADDDDVRAVKDDSLPQFRHRVADADQLQVVVTAEQLFENVA